ncbi:MAG TPA: M14 family zinc carboxypeptidase, partial [Puia sp.]
MQKYISLFFGLLFSLTSFSQTAPSPEAFLGYQLGDHYTPHYKIVNYFKEVARVLPSMVKVEQYGETFEGRPLLLAFIAAPENLSKLEDIRRNNLRLAGVLKDGAADENAPAIVWLSYNVHGNEPSSSEAAMRTLYSLVDPTNTRAREWLQHTVVVIDPCINPDGRDRYVN